MRVPSAWFLLFISTAHWLGCHLLFEVNYLIEVQHQMSQTEQLIADELKLESGLEGTIKVLDENEIIKRGNFYNDFVFSKEIDKTVVYFTIDYPPKTVTYEKVADQNSNPTPDNGLTLLLKGLFKEFIFPVQEIPAPAAESQTACPYWASIFPTSISLDILSPPPVVA